MNIQIDTIEKVKRRLAEIHGEAENFRIGLGVEQAAALWRDQDGSPEEFESFAVSSFVSGPDALDDLFQRLERNMELLNGHLHQLNVRLKEPLHLEGPPLSPVDMLFGSYNPSSHLDDDLFDNKIAFITVLNFPFYSLKEKTWKGGEWTRREWAYARMGDLFTSRVPAEVIQNASRVLTASDTYISEYNIFMGNLVDMEGKPLFNPGMKLISHWGLRDELKSCYADSNGLDKQRMIYRVMQRIIDQTIPAEVINKDTYQWNPWTNRLLERDAPVDGTPEDNVRYRMLLDNFHALRRADDYHPHFNTYISRAFEASMEIPLEDVEQLFTEFVSSPLVREVAGYIQQRLGRPLEPFDIWYNGFKPAGGIPEDRLTEATQHKYPSAKEFEKDLPGILEKIGWSPAEAQRIASLIAVEASRGAGHAWGAAMRNDLARLRTRVGPDGMDYKGYNIAVHELGHCVEQTITLNDVDFYMLNGVPNTAFTEATAFLFQKRDLELLDMAEDNPDAMHYQSLDNFWACYEIMGVSLVDMKVWKWLYQNPEAGAEELKDQVITIAKAVWNQFYAGILGNRDETILAVYSHMIDNPLYLSNYPVGHLIAFQIEQQVRGKSLPDEIARMYTQGRLVPQVWMRKAVGAPISIHPTLAAARDALAAFSQGPS